MSLPSRFQTVNTHLRSALCVCHVFFARPSYLFPAVHIFTSFHWACEENLSLFEALSSFICNAIKQGAGGGFSDADKSVSNLIRSVWEKKILDFCPLNLFRHDGGTLGFRGYNRHRDRACSRPSGDACRNLPQSKTIIQVTREQEFHHQVASEGSVCADVAPARIWVCMQAFRAPKI